MKEIKHPNWAYVTFIGCAGRGKEAEHYINGAICLNESLKKANSEYPLYCLCVNVSEEGRAKLKKFGIKVITRDPYPLSDKIDEFNKNNEKGCKYWVGCMDKLWIFNLYTRFEKIVYLDTDMIVFKNIDHLFNCADMSAVAEDHFYGRDGIEKKNTFNSGLMTINPSISKWKAIQHNLELLDEAVQQESFGVDDQSFLNLIFGDYFWKHQYCHLEPSYNVFQKLVDTTAIYYEDIKVGHYTGPIKPYMDEFTIPEFEKKPRAVLMNIEYQKIWQKVKKEMEEAR